MVLPALAAAQRSGHVHVHPGLSDFPPFPGDAAAGLYPGFSDSGRLAALGGKGKSRGGGRDRPDCDGELFAKFHSGMLAEGFYFACSLYETGFISTATTDEMIEDTIKASEKVFKAIANG